MNIFSTLSLTCLLTLFSNLSLADRESEMWQQFKAQKGMQELEAQFAEPKPEPEVVEKVIERVVEKPVYLPAPVAKTEPEPTPAVGPEPVTQPSAVTVESDGYIFKLSSCNLAHRNIKCQLNITSVDNDGELTLYGEYGNHSSKLFDRNGNEYQPSKVIMGNKNHKRKIRNKYISGVSAKGSIEYTNVDASTQSISMLELGLYNYNLRKYGRVQFRNVDLSL